MQQSYAFLRMRLPIDGSRRLRRPPQQFEAHLKFAMTLCNKAGRAIKQHGCC